MNFNGQNSSVADFTSAVSTNRLDALISGMPTVVFSPSEKAESRQWSGPVTALFPNDDRLTLLKEQHVPWRVLGGPGTGKTSLLADLATAYVQAGMSVDEVLVVTQSKDSAVRVRDEVSQQLFSDEFGRSVAGAGGMVRAVHSLAFAVVREAAVRRGDPEPSLTTGAKQDAAVRTLLKGHALDGGAYWPQRLKPALELRGMARTVRDFLLRANERGLNGSQLQQLGERYGIPEWSASGKFLEEYRQTMRLGWNTDLNAAELVSQALTEIEDDPEILQRWNKKIVLIDDAQHVDPQAARLLRAFVDHAELAIVTGDDDQSVLHFRGASTDFLHTFSQEDHTIVLKTSYRCVPEIAEIANCAVAKLPGKPLQRGIRGIRRSSAEVNKAAKANSEIMPTPAFPARKISIHESISDEYATIANFMRRLHIDKGVAWKDMVVLVRSGAGDSPLHRALIRAGVPVRIDPTDVVLGDQRIVKALLLALRATVSQLSEHEWLTFLQGPLGGIDPVSFERLLRGVRRTDLTGRPALDRIIDVLSAQELTPEHQELLSRLPEREQDLLKRPLSMLQAGRAARSQGVENMLWELWQSTGMADHLTKVSLTGGPAGATADRDLDATMALFDFAGDLVEANPQLTALALIRAVEEQELPIGARDRRAADRDVVNILSVHAALGREWKAVVVSGVQEGVWPSLGLTGSLLRQEELVALIDEDIEPGTPVSHLAERLAEERRLLHVALSRASEHLLVTAVDQAERDLTPSSFINELGTTCEIELVSAQSDGAQSEEVTVDSVVAPYRVLSVHSLVAELRKAVEDPAQTVTRRRQAAWQLARLAEAGVQSADPHNWWGLSKPSTMAALSEEGPVRVRPSKVESTLTCPLRAKLEPYSTSTAMSLGTMFHDAADAMANGVEKEYVTEEIRRVFPLLTDVPTWRQDAELQSWLGAIDSWDLWVNSKDSVGTEIAVSVQIADDVIIHGRIDKLIRNENGEVQVVDIKTSQRAVSKDTAEKHAQLATYQVALEHGRISTNKYGDTVIESGDGEAQAGAYLVYPRDTKSAGVPNVRVQAKLSAEQLDEWKEKIINVANTAVAPQALAIPNDNCQYCALQTSCPAQQGRR